MVNSKHRTSRDRGVQTRILLHIGAALLCIMAGCTDPAVVWTQGDGYRYRKLEVTGRSQAGFAEVPPQRSGIAAGNHVTPDAIVRNRHMMHGSGIAIGDVTGDGLPDVYMARLAAHDILYRNLGNWKFEDITVTSGLDTTAQATSGVVMADLDGDDDLDLLLTMPLGPGAVYHNMGAGIFVRDPNASGLRSSYASTTAALADVDRDGDLDAYIARYKRIALADSLPPEAITWDAVLQEGKLEPRAEFQSHYRFTRAGSRVIRSELAEPDGLYINDGNGHFSEVSWTDGRFLDTDGTPLTSTPRDWALTAKFYDLTGDGIADLYVCNDFDSPDELWIGLGDGRWQRAPGYALRKTSNATMSIDFSDVNRDGVMDFFATDMLSRDYSTRLRQRNTRIPVEAPQGDAMFRPQEMQNTLMLGRGDTTFAELAWFAGVAASDWSWATSFMDVDLDGWEDILITTGHVHDVQDLDAQGVEQQRMAAAPTWRASRALLLDFPPLALPNAAFRNRTDLTFEDMPGGWGFGESADIAHGMALGDLDGDGDLDVVTNRFNAPPGVYRNTGTSDRLAVMLKGKPLNTAGVGATIRVQCPNLPEQSRQISAGGSYLSSSQLMAVFAVKSLPCQIEVTWPGGLQSAVSADGKNRLYIIEESGAMDMSDSPWLSLPEPVYQLYQNFESVVEKEFDDFMVQPLLPWHLSRTGPALAAVDINDDGRFELLQGGSRGQMIRLEGRAILDSLHGDVTGLLALPARNDLTRVIAGVSRYEQTPDSSWIHVYDITPEAVKIEHQKLSFGHAVPGPLSLVDMDLDGDLDLFAGGHFVPGSYPAFADSRVYLNQDGTYRFSPELSVPLRQLGLASGSVFGDLDADGMPDLVVATEWGAVRVFRGTPDGFTDQTELLGLSQFRGWWRGVSLGDFDEDGALDIVASNAGWNHRYGRTAQVRLDYGDFNLDGRTDILESFFDPVMQIYRPSRMLADLVQVIQPFRMPIHSHRAFSTVDALALIPIQDGNSGALEANVFASSIFLNRGDHFEHHLLPMEAQYSAGISPVVLDANLDGHEDIILSQNWFAYPLSTPRQDAGRALLLLGQGNGTFSPADQSGFDVYGEGRAIAVADFDGDGQEEIAFAQHNGPTLLYRRTVARSGVSVRFDRPSEDAIGAMIRVVYADGSHGPSRVITAGTGYRSQNAVNVTLGQRDDSVTAVEVTWPGQEPVRMSLPKKTRVLSLRR